MSANSDNTQTLFSFELLVEFIRMEKGAASGELALGVRLLDFPTLLIYQPQQRSGDIKQQEQTAHDKEGEYAFNRGKACFFKMNLNLLHTHLSSSPLYAMVLDVTEDIPRLLGSSLISLAKVMDRIRQDVAKHGVSAPSSHGERGLVGICNLSGEKIGSISLSYKLLSLGAGLLPHIRGRRDHMHGGQHVQESTREKNTSTESPPLDCRDVRAPTLDRSTKRPANTNILVSEEKQDGNVLCALTEHRARGQIPPTFKEAENNFEDDLTISCPPHLYYSNSAEERSKNEGREYKSFTLDSEAFVFEDSCSEDEVNENEIQGTTSPVMHQKVRHNAKMSSSQETSGVSPNVLGEALRHLPLLNALLVELSQLNSQSPQQPLPVHPNLAWIYRPASPEPSPWHGNTPSNMNAKSQKTIQGTSPHVKHLHAPRNCSTPIVRPASVRKEDKQENTLLRSTSPSKSPRKKLVYGTTRTFNLRLKQISSLKVKRHKCMDLSQIEKQSRMASGKTKSSNRIMKFSERKSVLHQRSSLNENIETVMQNVTVDSAHQETITLKQKHSHGKVHGKQDKGSPRILEKTSLSERHLKFIRIPTVDSDGAARNKDRNEHHSESNQSQTESDRHREKIKSSGSSRHSSPKSSFSDYSGERNDEVDYADDFNSLEPSDAYSPDPVSSPEPCGAKTPKSPVHSDFYNSDSESVQKRTILPVPIKAPSSPQRALRGTHIIRPRTHASALSFSSDEGDTERSAALQTILSKKQPAENISVERTSGTESFISSRGEKSESTKTSGPIQGFSAELESSFEPQEAQELEDELGSLDFRKEYQHISELVANKLPGYTV
ncbi:microtubule-associated protein 10 [Mastacembelus armatus]|uniref:Microtubule associated protein 10 n=1 Tax=Mastacembelus armatus TaxID=205130 RepID=A0A3Q3MIQ0_9TELE|nr:microtubule-associated protein 10 [Mastacembelus armatus]